MKKAIVGVVVAAAVAFAVALTYGSPAYAGKAPAIGEPMPDFEMKDLTGKTHKLSDYKGKVVALAFVSKNCPWSRGADSGIDKLADAYGGKALVFGVDSDAGNSVEDVTAYVEKGGFEYPILKDVNNTFADAVGASRTPEFYIVDAEGKLAFHGAFDNRTVPEKNGDTHYAATAIDDLLGGKAVATPEVSAWGCTIKRASK